MFRRLKPLFALVLTGALLLGSVAGFSPLLHVWLEHGGRGPAHVHLPGSAPTAAETVTDSFAGPATEPIRIAVQPAAVRAHQLTLPSFALAKFWLLKFLHDFSAGPASENETTADAHQHDSLAQTLLNGLIVLAIVSVLWLATAGLSLRLPPARDGFGLNPVLTLLLPERAPPVGRG
jgi:hypothetical protein